MIATGIVKRIDNLGRIEIPKELRQKVGISTERNDLLEFYLDEEDNLLIAQKYDIGEIEKAYLYNAKAALKENDYISEKTQNMALTKIEEAIKILEESEEEG